MRTGPRSRADVYQEEEKNLEQESEGPKCAVEGFRLYSKQGENTEVSNRIYEANIEIHT